MLIKEAERVIASTEKLSWTEITDGQREVHDCAIERLRLLKSYKKNHAPDHYPFMREWPTWFNPNHNTDHPWPFITAVPSRLMPGL